MSDSAESLDTAPAMQVEDYLNLVNYGVDVNYIPSEFALEFVTFIKLIHGEQGPENKTPVAHYHMLDTLTKEEPRVANLCCRGSAKLQPGSSRVLTEYGWKTMRELQIGDKVVNRYGTLSTIDYKTPPQYPKMYAMTLSDGTELEVGDRHLHLVSRGVGKRYKEEVLSTTELLDKGITYNVQKRTTSRHPKAKYKWRIPLVEPVQFSHKPLPVAAYTLGLAISNAYYKGGTISCHADDLEELKSLVVSFGDTMGNSGIPCGNAGRFYIGKSLFKAYGSVTSRYKRIPFNALYGSVKQRTDLLRGLMDGDGSIAKNGGCFYSTYSFELAKDVRELVQGLGGLAKITSYDHIDMGRPRTEYRVRINVTFCPFYLKRKADKWKPTKKCFKLITAIKEIPCKEEGYCIHLDSTDHTYIAEGYTITHNTTLLAQYLLLYIAVYGSLPGLKNIKYALYVSDSMENGVKKMRLRLQQMWDQSPFLKEYVPEVRFTDPRWYFKNADGKEFVVTGHGAQTGVRGTVELNTRPQLAILDDLLSDEDARSATVIASIEDTVYKAVTYALHPSKNLIIWSGTPFNAKDPLYKAVESGAWAVNVFPVCEQFPCTQEEFKSIWPDRFTYAYVKAQYEAAMKLGKVNTFNQELMLRIMSDDDRLIQDGDIGWYNIDSVIKRKELFNFYITTDFATSEKQSSDFSVISVWALNNNGDWLWADGICKRQLMDQNINDLFRLAQVYKPQSVGVEVTGQQAGFIRWIEEQMLLRNVYFPLASDNNENRPGIRPNTNKMVRFNVVVPWFKSRKIYFPIEKKGLPAIQEAITELSLASPGGFRSKHDDFIDTISQLPVLNAWKPSATGDLQEKEDGIWGIEDEDIPDSALQSYTV
jgi:phage terminase large subunit-like protein